jgi:hypothetical protein
MYAEMAEAILEAHNDGRSTHDAEFVASRFQAVQLDRPSDPVEVHLADRRMSLGLALHYLDTAIDIAGRHGLDLGWRACQFSNGNGSWRSSRQILSSSSRLFKPPCNILTRPRPRRRTICPKRAAPAGGLTLWHLAVRRTLRLLARKPDRIGACARGASPRNPVIEECRDFQEAAI